MQLNLVSEVGKLNGNNNSQKSMKNFFIRDLKTDTKLTSEQFAVKAIRKGKTAQGRDYIDLKLSDKTGDIDGKIWDSNINNCQEPNISDIIELSGEVKEFRDKPQINISFLQIAKDFVDQDFLPSSTKDIEKLWSIVETNIKSTKNKHLKKLLDIYFTDEKFISQFKKAPAAEYIHHAYLGGLLEHTVEMLNLGNALFLDYENLDKDLLIAGILLHDIGKMQELAVNHTIYRTTEGNLLGHISIGAIKVTQDIEKIKDFPVELKAKLINMILSHHEKLEFGSPVKPMTQSAFALAFIDNLSAKVNSAQKVLDDNKDSELDYSDKNFALDTKLYLK